MVKIYKGNSVNKNHWIFWFKKRGINPSIKLIDFIGYVIFNTRSINWPFPFIIGKNKSTFCGSVFMNKEKIVIMGNSMITINYWPHNENLGNEMKFRKIKFTGPNPELLNVKFDEENVKIEKFNWY